MQYLHTTSMGIYLVQIFVSIFLAILFLQSGIDKIVDRRGNLDWLTGHFAKSPLAKMVPLLLSAITLLEIAAGALSTIGVVQLLLSHDTTFGFLGACASAIAILSLFLGQRLAKDYPGAAVLVAYFLVTIVAIMMLA